MNLDKTVDMMLSDDYRERFKAEYYQLCIRMQKLEKMLNGYAAGTLEFSPTCTYDLLTKQLDSMKIYKSVLELRAEREGVKL